MSPAALATLVWLDGNVRAQLEDSVIERWLLAPLFRKTEPVSYKTGPMPYKTLSPGDR